MFKNIYIEKNKNGNTKYLMFETWIDAHVGVPPRFSDNKTFVWASLSLLGVVAVAVTFTKNNGTSVAVASTNYLFFFETHHFSSPKKLSFHKRMSCYCFCFLFSFSFLSDQVLLYPTLHFYRLFPFSLCKVNDVVRVSY